MACFSFEVFSFEAKGKGLMQCFFVEKSNKNSNADAFSSLYWSNRSLGRKQSLINNFSQS
jgi:hypothetical protein